MLHTNTKYALLIGGELVAGLDVEPVTNPADLSIVGVAPVASPMHLDQALQAARSAFPAWSRLTWDERATYLQQLAAAIEVEKDSLARLLTLEQGKPYHTQALAEIQACIECLRDTATLRLPVKTLRDTPGARVEAHPVPIGVVGAITPWNFPVQLSIWKIAPNLLSGNTVVLKPAPTCPLTLLRVGELARGILPPGTLNILCGGNDLGALMCSHPGLAKITFTGSTATGKKVMANAANTLKRIVLELGGNDPAIVLPGCDPKVLAPTLFWSAFYNSGQNCVAIKRLYVHESLHREVLEELVAYGSTVPLGNGIDPTTLLGPVQNRSQYRRLLELIEDSKANGHRFALGGEPDPHQQGYFVPVTLIDNPPDSSRIVQEEQFGPILPVLSFKSIDEVVRRANDTHMGLAASVWGRDAAGVAPSLQAGTVWINQSQNFAADIPVSGHKESGYGIELGEAGLAACTLLQVRSIAKEDRAEGSSSP